MTDIFGNADVIKAEPVTAKSEGFKDTVPANWFIEAVEGDLITAVNHTSGETFEGEIAEFNVKLKG